MTAQSGDKPAGLAGGLLRAGGNPYLLLAAASLFWSGNHIVGRAINGEVPPLAISTLRWLIPAILLWPFIRHHVARDWPAIRAHWKIMLWLGVSGGALFTALQYVGLQYTGALNVSMLNSLVPVLIVATAALLFRERVSARQLTGIGISSAGVLVVIARGELSTLLGLAFNWGDLIILFNMIVFAIYATCLRLVPKIHPFSFLFILGVISAASTLPFAIWEAAGGYHLKPTLLTVAAIAYVSIFPSLVSYAAWNKGVELIGANRAGPFLHLIPIFTALLGTALVGEHIAVYQFAGFVLIIAGVWLAAKRAGVPA